MVSCDNEPSWISSLVGGTYQSVTLTCYQLASSRCQLKWNEKHHLSLEGDIISEVISLWIWVSTNHLFFLRFHLFFLHFGWSWKWILWPYIQWNQLALIIFFFLSNTVFHKCFWLWFAFAEWWFLYTFLLIWLRRINKCCIRNDQQSHSFNNYFLHSYHVLHKVGNEVTSRADSCSRIK